MINSVDVSLMFTALKDLFVRPNIYCFTRYDDCNPKVELLKYSRTVQNDAKRAK